MTKRPTRPPKAQDRCVGVFLTYTPSSPAPRRSPGLEVFIGFQQHEILVSTSGAVITDFPAHVGNGTTLVGFPQTVLMNAIDTAGGLSQIRMEIKMTGTQFGVKPPGTPMPRTIKLQNYGFKCPALHPLEKNPHFKAKKTAKNLFLLLQERHSSPLHHELQPIRGHLLTRDILAFLVHIAARDTCGHATARLTGATPPDRG
ncbi:hypothetical protein C4D60_Mb06t01960 [Musa balbisiana]|uniref:Uncharacterized protein n=1 Tax=Musa balbisiana TaxID=52838 RepID=A0A4S8IJW5_MUSBA|nr:hypothetical protein C4D60_Mb06t01960 [Musa balbisiana]